MSVIRTTFAALLLSPLAVLAAGKAVIQGGETTFTLEYDGPQLRLQDERRPGVHLVSRNGQLFAVTSAAGQPIVVSGGAVAGLLQAQGRGRGQFATGSEDIQRLVSLTDSGRAQTVGGVRGTIHRLVYVDRSGNERSEDVVLTRDPEVAELTRHFGQAALAFQQSTGVDSSGGQALMQTLDQRGLGLLRFGKHYELASLDRTPPAASRFALPSSSVGVPGLNGLEQLIPGLGQRR